VIKEIKVIYRGKDYKGYLVRDVSMDGGKVRVPKIQKSFELYPPEKFEDVFKNNGTVYILSEKK